MMLSFVHSTQSLLHGRRRDGARQLVVVLEFVQNNGSRDFHHDILMTYDDDTTDLFYMCSQ
jgi:hypothetical protein